MKDAYSVYQTANVDTADQGKLIVVAYDVAIRNCRLALEVFDDRKRLEERTKHLLKVQDAIGELMGSLNLEVGEIARNLYRLYDYMIRRLIHANARNEGDCITEVLGYLTKLRDAWQQAVRTVRNANSGDAEGAAPAKSIAVTG